MPEKVTIHTDENVFPQPAEGAYSDPTDYRVLTAGSRIECTAFSNDGTQYHTSLLKGSSVIKVISEDKTTSVEIPKNNESIPVSISIYSFVQHIIAKISEYRDKRNITGKELINGS